MLIKVYSITQMSRNEQMIAERYNSYVKKKLKSRKQIIWI